MSDKTDSRKEYEDRLLTAKDIMNITGRKRTFVYSLFKKPDFPTLRIGRYPAVSEKAFWEWCNSRVEKSDANVIMKTEASENSGNWH